MPRRRRIAAKLPLTRYQQGVKIRKQQEALGSMVIAIDKAARRLNHRMDRAIERCRPGGSGSIIGSVVQVPRSEPRHELEFAWLDDVRQSLERLLGEAP